MLDRRFLVALGLLFTASCHALALPLGTPLLAYN